MRAFLWWFDRTGTVGGIGLFALLITVVIAPFGVYQRIHDDSFRRYADRTTGIVVDQVDSGGRSGGTRVTVDFSVGGHDYRFTQDATAEHVEGKREAVLYDPARPSHAELADTGLGDSQLEFNLMLVFGGAFVALSVLGFLVSSVGRLRKRRRARPGPPSSPTASPPSMFEAPPGS